MELNRVTPSIPLSGPLEWARLIDGSREFAMAPVGWQVAAPHSDDYDEWIVVRIRVRAPECSWEAQAAPFLPGALRGIATWAGALADGNPVPGLSYDDPELELDGAAGRGDARHVEVTLRQHFVPDELDDPDVGFALGLDVTAQQLRVFADTIRLQATLVPEGRHRSAR